MVWTKPPRAAGALKATLPPERREQARWARTGWNGLVHGFVWRTMSQGHYWHCLGRAGGAGGRDKQHSAPLSQWLSPKSVFPRPGSWSWGQGCVLSCYMAVTDFLLVNKQSCSEEMHSFVVRYFLLTEICGNNLNFVNFLVLRRYFAIKFSFSTVRQK